MEEMDILDAAQDIVADLHLHARQIAAQLRHGGRPDDVGGDEGPGGDELDGEPGRVEPGLARERKIGGDGRRRTRRLVAPKAVEELFARAVELDKDISIATVYRTVKLFEEAGIIDRLEFGDGRARYEDAERDHHDHLIDLNSGEVIEFVDPEIEALQEKIAKKLGYRLKGHRLELFGVPIRKP